MELLKETNFVLALSFLVPGFLSIRIYGLLRPSAVRDLKDQILEAIAFGSINFAIMFWPISWIVEPRAPATNPYCVYLIVLSAFLLAPVIWPILLHRALRALSRKGLIINPHHSAWDHYFGRRESCWVIVHLADGRKIGGWYGPESFAGLHPNSGHLYLQKLWKLDANGAFSEPVSESRGIVLRPTDYHFIEFFDEGSKPDGTAR